MEAFPTGAVIYIHGRNLQQYDNNSKVYIKDSELEIKCLQHPFHWFQVIIPGVFVEKNSQQHPQKRNQVYVVMYL